MSQQSVSANCVGQIAMIRQAARPAGLFLATSLCIASAVSGAFADSAGATFSQGNNFTEQTGEALYANVCQACHMDQGQGAIGAGRYPALAKDENLEAGRLSRDPRAAWPERHAAVGQMMSDEQVAAVVNYVRTNFGNNYTDAVTTQDVADQR